MVGTTWFGIACTPGGYSENAVVVEYNADGTLNTAFGSSGVAVSSAAVAWMSLVVLANGNLLVTDGSNLAEYDGTGHPVTGFGSGGIATTSMTIAAFQPLANGKILASGYIYQEGYVVDLAVERFNANGTLDTTFGVNGTGLSPVYDLGDGTIGAISVLASGEILVAGTAGDYNGNSDLVLTEFTAEGTLDVSFNYGIAFIPMGTYDTASAMTILPSGEILVGGELDAMNIEGFLAKYEVDSSGGSYGGGNQTLTYTYDVRGKLIGIARDGRTVATYAYDDHGNRVSETVGGVTTLYLIDTNNPTGYAQPMEAKSSATGKPITTWIIGDRVFGQADSAGNVSYLLADGHGSTRLLTSATGTITAAFNYDAFGTALNFNAGMAATPFLFGGDSFYDAPSGLNFHGDGTRQRFGFLFMESDFGPRGQGNKNDPLSLHKYLYADGNPINENDPTGHFTLLDMLHAEAIGMGMEGTGAVAGNAVEAIAEEVAGEAEATMLDQSLEIDEIEAECEGGCFVAGTDVLLGDGKTEEQIQDIHVGDRVATDDGVANSADGKTAAADSSATQVDPATWRLVTMQRIEHDADGTTDVIEIQTLEPLSEIEAGHEQVGSVVIVPLDTQEMGLSANATAVITSIDACPHIASGPGRVVLTTVSHLTNDLFNLTLTNSQGQAETLGVTGTHRFYTEDRGWVVASDLRMGELVQGANGDVTVMALIANAGVHEVYNMTVEADHDYYVGYMPALVHNNCNSYELGQNLEAAGKGGAEAGDAAHIVPAGMNNPIVTEMQDILEEAGIDINDAENGFRTFNSTHMGSHTAEFLSDLFDLLSNAAGDQSSVSQILEYAQQALESGVYL